MARADVPDRDEAVFPGVEWLVDDEVSSGSLDIAEGHPDRIRAVVHPNWVTIPAIGIHGRHGTVGLLWDVHQKWDGTRDRPGVYFGSPDQAHNYRSHQIGLFAPNPPEFIKPNTWEITSQKAYRLEPGKKLKLEALIYADGDATDALAAVDEWFRVFGCPEPASLPHGSYEREIEFSMQAYLKSLWEPETKDWWTTKGGGMMSNQGRPRAFVADLLIGEVLSPDEEVRRACRARADEVLAAADAVDAYVEAYRFSGHDRWLRDAATWARRGLPFIYLWDDPEKPFLIGGSIPVFGATWYQGSWFGRPVQWNGLRYANALLKLAEYDESYPWRRIAETIIRSAIHQQDLDGENVALWPDNISAIDCAKCPWVFAPRQIIRNVLKLTGRDEDPATVIIGEGDRRLHVTACANISDAAWEGAELSFRVVYARGEQGVVLVSNVARPEAVLLDGEPVAERREVENGMQPGWRYDPANAYLSIRVHHEGESLIQVDGAEFRSVRRLPWLVERIAFEFDGSLEG